jgi:hypothetical protein
MGNYGTNVNQSTWQYFLSMHIYDIIEAAAASLDNRVAPMFDFVNDPMSPV